MKKLIILEMVNNHMGDIPHGKSLIESFASVAKKFPEFDYAFKFQYRQLDTFIHPSMQGRMDVKFIKRFSETRLMREQFEELIDVSRNNGFHVLSTPFDEESVDLIEDQNLDFIKIASCSFGDWPLMERIARSNKQIIASTAGASLDLIDQVVAFFQNRNKDLTIMHCVGEYPTADEKMNVNQIEFLKKRYPEIKVGFSTHENPNNFDIVKLAAAKGADVFEKHVGLPTENYPNNAYSVDPVQFDKWLAALKWSESTLGISDSRSPVNEDEQAALLGLRRGVFVKTNVKKGESIDNSNVYFAFPPNEGQVTTIDWSKYKNFIATTDLGKDDAVTPVNSESIDLRDGVLQAAKSVANYLSTTDVVVPVDAQLELSHHYGLVKFYETGLTLITVVNREYCKKILVSLPNQFHPEQYHKQKEETFHILHGEVDLILDGVKQTNRVGDVITIMPGIRHAFVSKTGCVIEEISSTHYVNDSFYTDEKIAQNLNRKTTISHWRGL